MAVSRITKSSVLQGFPKSRSLLAGNAAYDPAATWLIQRITATGGETTITFSSIPQTYKHLQLRCIVKDTYTASNGVQTIGIRFNSDSGSNYAGHNLRGNGTAAAAGGGASSTIIDSRPIISVYGNLANYYGAAIIDIHDYASTTKYKTVRSFNGADINGSGEVALSSGLWMNTAAISTITIVPANGPDFAANCHFALYGIKG